jgi:hypothetical protein
MGAAPEASSANYNNPLKAAIRGYNLLDSFQDNFLGSFLDSFLDGFLDGFLVNLYVDLLAM